MIHCIPHIATHKSKRCTVIECVLSCDEKRGCQEILCGSNQNLSILWCAQIILYLKTKNCKRSQFNKISLQTYLATSLNITFDAERGIKSTLTICFIVFSIYLDDQFSWMNEEAHFMGIVFRCSSSTRMYLLTQKNTYFPSTQIRIKPHQFVKVSQKIDTQLNEDKSVI